MLVEPVTSPAPPCSAASAVGSRSATAAEAAEPPGPGLVPIQTSPTDCLALLRTEARVRRLRKAVRSTATVVQEGLGASGRRWRAAMVTLTYRRTDEWRSRHVSAFLEAVQAYARRRGFSVPYVWVAEMQQRGAVHYHVLIWLPRGVTLPKPDKRGWWPHGSTRIEWARSAIAYLTKYASKADGVSFPKGLRLHGSGGLSAVERIQKRYRCAPLWVRELTAPDAPLRRVPGGWVDLSTGELHHTPWVVISRGPRWEWVVLQKRPSDVQAQQAQG